MTKRAAPGAGALRPFTSGRTVSAIVGTCRRAGKRRAVQPLAAHTDGRQPSPGRGYAERRAGRHSTPAPSASMRISLGCLAAAAALTACAPAQPGRGTTSVPALEPSSPNAIWVLEHRTPRCPFREVGRVSGRTYRQLQDAAFRLHANAVIMEPEGSNQGGIRYGTAVQYTRADCKE
jgi:hypothetical protein